jgi:hypothetical protein
MSSTEIAFCASDQLSSDMLDRQWSMRIAHQYEAHSVFAAPG